jgi:hypothetical protein
MPDWVPVPRQIGAFVEGGSYTYERGDWVLELTASAAAAGASITWEQTPGYPYMLNGGFESADTSSWAPLGALTTLTRVGSPNPVHSGSWAMKVSTESNNGGGIKGATGGGLGSSPSAWAGRTIPASIWVQAPAGATLSLSVGNDSGFQWPAPDGSSGVKAVAATGAWQQITTTVKAPASITQVPSIYLVVARPGGATIYVDDAALNRGTIWRWQDMDPEITWLDLQGVGPDPAFI